MTQIEITGVRIYPFDTSEAGGKTLAMADVTINHALLLKAFRIVMATGGGVFVGFPSLKGKDGKWRETVIPADNETKKAIRDRIVEEYKAFEPGAV